jgi:hypothetical protein
MRNRYARRSRSLLLRGSALLLLTASQALPGAPLQAAGEGASFIFADGFESGDDSLWSMDEVLWLPFGSTDLERPVQFAPVDPRADLVFSIDRTASMAGEISNLLAGLNTIHSAALAMVPDTQFAVGSWQDFPLLPFGDPADRPWELRQTVTSNLISVQSALNGVTPAGGHDVAESGYEALYQVGAGTGVSWPGGSVPAFPGPGGGGVGLRTGTLPLVIHVTDADSHTDTDYAASIPEAHSKSEAFAALAALGARILPILSLPNATADTQLREAATITGAEVLPCGFTHGAGCPPTQCCTGLNGAGEAPNGSGRCPLRFRIPDNGSGASTAVVLAMEAAVKYGTHQVIASAEDDGSAGTLDTTCFIDRIEADLFLRPPQEPEMSCVSEALPAALGGLGYEDGFTNLATGSVGGIAGSMVQFVVHASNDCAPSMDVPQIYDVHLNLTDFVTGALMDHLTLTVAVPAAP